MNMGICISLFFFLLSLAAASSLPAQEAISEGEFKGIIVNDGSQVFKISPIKPGQTLQLALSLQWFSEKEGTVKWRLEDQGGTALKAGSRGEG